MKHNWYEIVHSTVLAAKASQDGHLFVSSFAHNMFPLFKEWGINQYVRIGIAVPLFYPTLFYPTLILPHPILPHPILPHLDFTPP